MIKKILFVNSTLSGGGSERVMCLIANQFDKLGYDTTMVLVRDSNQVTYKINKNIKLIKFQYKLNNKFTKMLSRIFKLRKVIKKENYDCIISFMSDINLCTLASVILLNKKVIVSERADPAHSGRSKLQFLLEKILYPRAYKVVLQTEYVKKYFSKKIVVKSVVIPNPINDGLPKRNKQKINNVIVAAGRMTEQKNFKLLIDAYNDFNKLNNKYKLIIYGDGPLKNDLKKYVNELKLEDKVSFPGYVDNVDEQMKDCWCYVSSSNYEGISNSMLEAMAMGIPSICTDCPVGGASLIIKNKKNGLLVQVGNKNDLVNSLVNLDSDKKLYDDISNNALKINDNYSIDKIVDMWINIM